MSRIGKIFRGRGRDSDAPRGQRPERVDPALPEIDGVTAPKQDDTVADSMNSENHANPNDNPESADAPADNPEQAAPEDAVADEAMDAAESLDGDEAGEGDPRDERILELEDQMLRAKAEIQNMQRRSREELAKARKYGAEHLAGALLDVRDNLERAIAAADDASDGDAVVEGVKLTLKQLDDAFDKHKVTEVESVVGMKLDPSVHSAMSTQPTNDVPPNHIAAVIQKGFSLHDRLLRPAMVMVAAPLPDGNPAPEADGDEAADA